MKFPLNIDRIVGKTTERVIRDVDRGMSDLEVMVDRLTPEDTGRMLEHNKREPATVQGNVVTSKVYNDVSSRTGFPYAKAVEKGVRGKIYSYQKPRGNSHRYVGVGVHTFERALAAMRPIILQFLKR